MGSPADFIPWTTREVEILVEHYAELGPAWICREGLLPGRSKSAILRMASRKGLRYMSKDIPEQNVVRSRPDFGIQDPILKRAVCGRWR